MRRVAARMFGRRRVRRRLTAMHVVEPDTFVRLLQVVQRTQCTPPLYTHPYLPLAVLAVVRWYQATAEGPVVASFDTAWLRCPRAVAYACARMAAGGFKHAHGYSAPLTWYVSMHWVSTECTYLDLLRRCLVRMSFGSVLDYARETWGVVPDIEPLLARRGVTPL
jgi:hypothetical protein